VKKFATAIWPAQQKALVVSMAPKTLHAQAHNFYEGIAEKTILSNYQT
jgi:hypothetical protein